MSLTFEKGAVTSSPAIHGCLHGLKEPRRKGQGPEFARPAQQVRAAGLVLWQEVRADSILPSPGPAPSRCLREDKRAVHLSMKLGNFSRWLVVN